MSLAWIASPLALKPAWLISLVTICLSWASGLIAFMVPIRQVILVAVVLGSIVLAIQIAWSLSAYALANKGLARTGGSAHWLFLGHAILGGSGIALCLNVSILLGVIALIAAAVVYFWALVIVADAIVQAEHRKSNFGSIVGTALLLAALPLGVWFLMPRMQKLTVAT